MTTRQMICILVLCLATALPASAANIVANGSFETPVGNGTIVSAPGGGAFGWEVGDWVGVYGSAQAEAMPAQQGNQTMGLFAGGSDRYIWQTLPTVARKRYNLTFWTKGWDGTPGAQLDVEWLSGGNNQISGWYYVSMPGGWTKTTIKNIMAGTNDDLVFQIAFASPAHIVIDDVQVEESTDVLANGSFETPVGNNTIISAPGGGSFGWEVGDWVGVYDSAQAEAMPAQDGNQTMGLFGGATAARYISQTMQTVAGKKYDLSFWTKGWNGVAGAQMNLEWLSGGVNQIIGWWFNSMPGNWTKTTIKNIPAGDNDTLKFQMAYGTGHIVMDDVRVVESPPSSDLVANGSFEQPPGDNISIPAPGGGMFGWTVGDTVFVYNSYGPAMPAKDGSQTLGMLAGSATRYISQTIPTVAGKAYELSFWTKGWAGASGAQLNVEWLSGGVNQINGWYYNTMPSGWTKTSLRVFGGNNDTIKFQVAWGSPAHLIIDDVRVVEIQPVVAEHVSDLRGLVDGQPVVLNTSVVTAGTGAFADNMIFVEDASRAAGIGVQTTPALTSVVAGNRVKVTGRISTYSGAAPIIIASNIEYLGTGDPLTPLGMGGKSVGDSGAPNTGLLVKVWGKVRNHASYCSLDDGSGTGDGNGNVGTPVVISKTLDQVVSLPPDDAYTWVVGISGKANMGRGIVPVVYPIKSPSPTTSVWSMAELNFKSALTYANPYTDVQFSATFTGPGPTLTVPGFWDGGSSWKVRFTPTAPGVWSYTTACNTGDGGLNGKSGSLTAVAPTSTNPIYAHGGLLKVGSNGHYLTYTDGTPFFWLGDQCYYCPSVLMPFDSSSNPDAPNDGAFPTVMDKRRSQGFSVAHLGFCQYWSDPDFVGDRCKRVSQNDINYWRNVDRYMAYANDSGMVVNSLLAVNSGLDRNTLDEWKTVWRYFLARYGAYAITFCIAGDYQDAPANQSHIDKVFGIGTYIKQIDPYQRAITVNPVGYRYDGKQHWSQSWCDFIQIKGEHFNPLHTGANVGIPSHTVYTDAFNYSTGRPVMDTELDFEGIHPVQEDAGYAAISAGDVRWAAYRAFQSGCFGFTYGAHGLWYPTQNTNDTLFWDVYGHSDPWWVALEYPGATQMTYLRQTYESVNWWNLVPLPDAVTTSPALIEIQRILTKADSTNAFVIYFPSAVAYNMAAVLHGAAASATYGVQWRNPGTGAVTTAANVTSISSGNINLPNRPAATDWVLILRKLN